MLLHFVFICLLSTIQAGKLLSNKHISTKTDELSSNHKNPTITTNTSKISSKASVVVMPYIQVGPYVRTKRQFEIFVQFYLKLLNIPKSMQEVYLKKNMYTLKVLYVNMLERKAFLSKVAKELLADSEVVKFAKLNAIKFGYKNSYLVEEFFIVKHAFEYFLTSSNYFDLKSSVENVKTKTQWIEIGIDHRYFENTDQLLLFLKSMPTELVALLYSNKVSNVNMGHIGHLKKYYTRKYSRNQDYLIGKNAIYVPAGTVQMSDLAKKTDEKYYELSSIITGLFLHV